MVSEAEQRDLDLLHKKLREEKENFSSLMCEFLTMDQTMLGHCGHKTLASALESSVRDHKKTLERLAKSHVSKWPD